MTFLHLDIETYGDVSIKDCGAYAYTESPVFDIILLTYAFDDQPEIVVDLTKDILPEEVENALTDPEITKVAYNAAFERRCFSVYLKKYLPPEQWLCIMIKSAMVGLPFGLDAVAKALRIEQGKLSEGKALIRYFCQPCKPTKSNGMRTRNLPHHAPEKWAAFMQYNKHDVVLEKIIDKKIEFFEIPEIEKKLWALDQRMNDKGVLLDKRFIDCAIKMNEADTEKLMRDMQQLTGVDNPNSGAQLKKWLSEQLDDEIVTLTKKAVIELKQTNDSFNDDVGIVLELKQELAKTSNKKYPAMLSCMCADGRARGTIQYYGAGRTGRYSGRLFQPQNLTKPILPNKNNIADYYELTAEELDLARKLVYEGNAGMIEFLFGNVPDTLSACLRTALISAPGKRFIAVDLSAIEARVIAWLAGESWKLEVFKTHGKIYEAAGSRMFKVPIESIKKGSRLRDKSKIAELALGFQGGVQALIKMHALEMGLIEDELQPLVWAWRSANPNIVRFWHDLNEAAIRCVRDRVTVKMDKGIKFHIEKNVLFITLPSGRRLAYLRPMIRTGKFGNECVSYEGIDQNTKQWVRIDTYGGKIAENIVQGTARDVLAEKMLLLDKAGYNLLLSVHDEIVMEEAEGVGSLEECVKIMSVPVAWAKGLPLGADGFESKYYKK